MTLHLHHLQGCAPAPLALYLKAVGILRLVSEQADSAARGWWQDEHFCLLTKLDREAFDRFFLEEYAPTPVFNPWGGRSGFYDGSPEKTSRMALEEVERSQFERLRGFRSACQIVRELAGTVKPANKEDQHALVSGVRRSIRGPAIDWLSTVLADLGEDNFGPPIFGTGGNEGSGSYTAAYFAAINECIVCRTWDSQIHDCLYEIASEATRTWDGSFFARETASSKKPKKKNVDGPFRQFLPEGALSPWDLLLMFEGACAFHSGVVKRSSDNSTLLTSSPFYFRPHGIGTGASCDADEYVVNKGRRQPGRGEQWFPIWNQPCTYSEVKTLLVEGKCSIGRNQAQKPLDAARAIRRLGVSRGVDEFIRYGYYQRNNMATHFAVPLGRIRVPKETDENARLIDDIAPWMQRLQRLSRDTSTNHPPARLVHAERRLANAVFEALTHDHTPQRWHLILGLMVDIESIQQGGTAIQAGPIPRLQPGWIKAAADDSPEFRLALALGSAATGYRKNGRAIDPVRHHWLPLEQGAYRFQVTDKRLAKDTRVVMTGRDPVADCAAVAQRRLIEAEHTGQRHLPLKAAFRCDARLEDLARLINGDVDLDRTIVLARAFMALDWSRWNPDQHLPEMPKQDYFSHPDEAWLAIRLACLPKWKASADPDSLSIPCEPAMVSRLLAGDGGAAVRIAARRLGAHGIRVPFQSAITDSQTARLWAAALVYPISRWTAKRAVEILVPDYFGEHA
ncbi:MAG: type I-U CRISPR-associated protein Csx17 [Planctomycetaceae bacterium]|nr:type I-U CRISPR-associated protein Csx17 [Planctomycetaceae bacterium]